MHCVFRNWTTVGVVRVVTVFGSVLGFLSRIDAVIFPMTSTPTTAGINPSTGFPMVLLRSSSTPPPPPPPTTTTESPSSTPGSNPTVFDQIAKELECLALTHGMVERQHDSRSRRSALQPRHAVEFPSSSLFDRMARVVCQVIVIPRKELFETWAMALYVHRTFWSPSSSLWSSDDNDDDDDDTPITRIADVACSHGLLSWALLLLARYDETTGEPLDERGQPTTTSNDDDNTTTTTSSVTHSPGSPTSRSVVCIDLHMPKSAEKLATEMLKEWPDLADSWDYVEGPLEAIIPSPSTLLVGIHACGILSDKMVSHTIQGGCSLALVPCCHSKKSLSKEQKILWASTSSTADNSTSSNTNNNHSLGNYTLADFMDQFRIQQLETAGFEIRQATIPHQFTPKNRIILAKPRDATAKLGTEHVGPQSMRSKDQLRSTATIPDWAKPKFMIPLADTPDDRAIVRGLAGREAAQRRYQNDPKHHTAARSVHLSLFLPPHNIQLSVQDLQPALAVVEGCQVEALCPQPYLHPTAGRYVRTFKVTFPPDASKMQCRDYFQAMRQRIPEVIPGASVRY